VLFCRTLDRVAKKNGSKRIPDNLKIKINKNASEMISNYGKTSSSKMAYSQSKTFYSGGIRKLLHLCRKHTQNRSDYGGLQASLPYDDDMSKLTLHLSIILLFADLCKA
jgi:hypothetical protein